ncbi:endo-1,4-beta-xylanase xylA, putative (macronuclear) [Tetrahymena thermophila SB210]|uniref:Endo-1,4-beta-xylanase xylA, putative n=1 Tax=Tetrahymena thermophila (strain SB210) TaxID=312017 RepID=I7LTM2_TETTS|nr:endo-1,4-beta-xylanase xylA, putative [Tetrahymena thermophila SB210]EAR85503.2 endo-1,4-beta-xylanase xylA, putative [Tetrahymena thermophila SB210]|eukprot:XP_001033166.2 endo-1,4-beta-xylanase xylA, putative [Tetrahymena thermophila SB210]
MNYQNKNLQAQMLNFLSHNNMDKRCSNSNTNTPRASLQIQGLNNNKDQSLNQALLSQQLGNQISQQKSSDLKNYHTSSSCLSERSYCASGIKNLQNNFQQNSVQYSQRNKSFYNPQYLQTTPIRMSELDSQKINQRLAFNQDQMNQNVYPQRTPLGNGNNINIQQQQNPPLQQQVQNRYLSAQLNEKNKLAGQQQIKENIGRIQILKTDQNIINNRKDQQENVDVLKDYQKNQTLVDNQKQYQQQTLTQSQSQERGIKLVKNLLEKKEIKQQDEQANKKIIIITHLNPSTKINQQSAQSADFRQNIHQQVSSPIQAETKEDNLQEVRGISLMKQYNPALQSNSTNQTQIKDQNDKNSLVNNFNSFQMSQQKLIRSTSLPFTESQNLQFRQPLQKINQIQQEQLSDRRQSLQLIQNHPQSQLPAQINNNQSYQTPFQSVNALSQNNSLYSSSTQSFRYIQGLNDRRPHSTSMSNQVATPKSESFFQSNLVSQNMKHSVSQQLSPKQNPFFNKQINSQLLIQNQENILPQYANHQKAQQIVNQTGLQQQVSQNKQNISRSSSMYSQGGVVIKNNDMSANTSLCKYDKKQLQQNLLDKDCDDDRFQIQPSTIIQPAQMIIQQQSLQQQQQQYQYRQNQVIDQAIDQHNIHSQNNLNYNNQMKNSNFISQHPQNQFKMLRVDNIVQQQQFMRKLSTDLSPFQIQGNNQYSPSFGANITFPLQNLSSSQFPQSMINVENMRQNIENEKFYVQQKFQDELKLSLEKLIQQKELNPQIDTHSFQTVQSPHQQDYLPCESESIQICNDYENKFNSEKKKTKESNQKSVEKNTFDKIEECESPIQLATLKVNQSKRSIQSPTQPQVSDFSAQKSPTNSIGLSEEEKLWNKMSPEARKALIKINIDKQCDKMILEIQKEKEHRIEKQCDKMIKQIQKEKEIRISQQNQCSDGIPFKQNLEENIKIENQLDLQDSEDKIKRAGHRSQLSVEKQQPTYSNEKQQPSPVNQQCILVDNTPQSCLPIVSNFTLQCQNQILKVENLLKDQTIKENSILLHKSQMEKDILIERKSLKLQDIENKDEQNITDPQFTFSNTKENDWSYSGNKIKREFDFSPEKQNQLNNNNPEFNNNEFKIDDKLQTEDNHKQDSNVYNFENQSQENNQIQQTYNNYQDIYSHQKQNKIINIQQVKLEQKIENQNDENDNNQKQNNRSSEKEQKLIKSDKKLNDSQNKKINQVDKAKKESNKKRSISPSSSNNSVQGFNQSFNTKQTVDKSSPNQQQLDKKTNTGQSETQQTKAKVSLKTLNIEQLEKEAEIIQKQISSELFFTPKNNLEGQHFGLFYETRKEKKLRTLQENIQKNVEKILPNARDSELKKICQSIYESVFSLLREKYNIEVSSSSKSNDNSLSQNLVSCNNIASQRGTSNLNTNVAGVKQIEKSSEKINQNKQDLDFKDICISPINKLSNKITQSNEKREKCLSYYTSYSQKDEEIISKSQKMLDSKYSSHEKKEINNYGSNLIIPSVFDEQIIFRKSQQLEEFKQLLLSQDFEELSGNLFNVQKQADGDQQFLENLDGGFIVQNSFDSQKNDTFIQYETELNNQNSSQQQTAQIASPRNNQKIQPCLSPIREIESTNDQIHQSNFGKYTNNDYANTSGDERFVSNQNNFDSQKSRSIFKTQKGIEEQTEEEEEYTQQKEKNNQQTFNRIDEANQVNKCKNEHLGYLQNKVHSCENQNVAYEKLCEEDQNIEQLIKREDQEKNRQAYYENNKQKNYIFVPLCQQQDSQILSSISPTHQHSSQQNSLNNSRKVSTHQFGKVLNTNEDWEQLLNISKALNKSNLTSKIHLRKSSLQNLAAYTPLTSAQNTQRIVGSSQKPIQKKQENQIKKQEKPQQQQNKSQNFAQEYLKKCQSTKRQQEEQQLKRIKKTLIANFKYGKTFNINNQEQKENKLLKQSSAINQFSQI